MQPRYSAGRVGGNKQRPIFDAFTLTVTRELQGYARDAGLRWLGASGMAFDPLARRWRMGDDLGVNYIAAMAVQPPPSRA